MLFRSSRSGARDRWGAARCDRRGRRRRAIPVPAPGTLSASGPCVAYSRAANPTGGATVVVVGPSANIVYAARSDGQIPNNFDSAFEKAKMALYMRAPTRSMVNRWGSPEAALARAPLNLYLVEGGYPIIVEDMMVGALGVGGASGGDEECGHAALTKVLGPQPPIVPPVRPNAVGPAAPPAQGR